MLLTLLQSIIEVVVVVPTQEQPVGYASTYNKREKTRQEQYDEYIKEKTKRNNYLIMMLST